LYLEPLEDRSLPSSLLPVSDPFANAQTVVVSGTGITSQAGSIATPGEVDTFKFTAPITGLMTIELSPSPGIPYAYPQRLDVFDESQNLIAHSPTPAYFESSSVSVIQGNNYFVEVGTNPYDIGSYLLNFSPDDFGNTFADAHTVTLNSLGSGSQMGSIELPGDTDMFKFTAPTTGLLAIQLSGLSTSLSYNEELTVYDASHNTIDRRSVRESSLTEFSINVVAGRLYFVQVDAGDAFTGGSGPYVLKFSPDDFSNTFDHAHPIVVDSQGFGIQTGTIELPEDVDTFQFVAPYSGLMQLQLAGPGIPFHENFSVSDAGHQVIAGPSFFTKDPLRINFQAGQTYYAQVFGISPDLNDSHTVGPYVLTFVPVPDDFGDTFATAYPLQLNGLGDAGQTGTFERADDVDMFQFVANRTGIMTIRAGIPPIDYGNFDLSVFNSSQEPITSMSGFSLSHEAIASFPIIEGGKYYLRLTPSDPSQIGYSIGLASDDSADTLATAQLIPFSERSVAGVLGMIDYGGDTDMFKFTAPKTGPVTFQITAVNQFPTLANPRPPINELEPVLDVFDGSGKVIVAAPHDTIPFADPISSLSLNVSAGQTYYLQVSDFFTLLPIGGVGPFSLKFHYDDFFGNPFGGIFDVTRAPPSGLRNQPGFNNIAVFRLVSTDTELLNIQNMVFDGTRGIQLQLFDQSEQFIADTLGDQPLEIEALSGETFFVRVESEGGALGEYDLTFSGIPVPVPTTHQAANSIEAPSSFTTVLILNGPGFEKGLDIYSVQASGVSNPEPSRVRENLPIAEAGIGLLAPLFYRGSGYEVAPEKSASNADSSVIRFMIGLEDPFAPKGPKPRDKDSNSDSPPPDNQSSNDRTQQGDPAVIPAAPKMPSPEDSSSRGGEASSFPLVLGDEIFAGQLKLSTTQNADQTHALSCFSPRNDLWDLETPDRSYLQDQLNSPRLREPSLAILMIPIVRLIRDDTPTGLRRRNRDLQNVRSVRFVGNAN
jgi:hypothetical protein